MRSPMSVVFSEIYMYKMENDVLKPLKPIFYKNYVGQTYVIKKHKKTDTLFVR